MERKFIADVMMGGFVRLMRIMGFDVHYDRSMSPEEMVTLARREGRTIVTRRRHYRFPEDVEVLILRENYPHEQVEKVLQHFNIKPREEDFLSRCLVCNMKLVELSREDVKGKVPQYVFMTREEFASCPSCGRIYWEGTHHANMKKMVEMFFQDSE